MKPIFQHTKGIAIALIVLFLLSLWAIISIQFHLIPVIKTSWNDDIVAALNSAYLTLSYSYIAALLFYLLTNVLPAKQRRDKLDAIIKRRVKGLGRCFRDILLEFSRDTDFKAEINNTTDTETILHSKDWFAEIPMMKKYHNRSITYLQYMNAVGGNLKSQISNLIMKYHGDMTADQLVELENLSDASFFHTIEFICSMPNTSIADSGYKSLIKDFCDMQKQYLKVEAEFGIIENND